MRKLLLTLTLVIGMIISMNAQNAKGDWYIGTGDIANVAWTDWAVAPTVGYAFTDNLMVGVDVSQADSTEDLSIDVHARYFFKGFFAYAATEGFETDALKLGVGKMFTFHKSVFVDPKVVYDSALKTTNLQLGVGLKF
jgi:hypothetical protein